MNLKLADMIGESGDDHHKIERYLVDDDIKKKRALPSLTDLYDDMLDVIPDDQVRFSNNQNDLMSLETREEDRRAREAGENNEKN